jgi:hypothetical protein
MMAGVILLLGANFSFLSVCRAYSGCRGMQDIYVSKLIKPVSNNAKFVSGFNDLTLFYNLSSPSQTAHSAYADIKLEARGTGVIVHRLAKL